GAKKVVVDVDAAELRKFKFKLDVGVVASADLFVEELLSKLDKVVKKDRSPWFAKCRQWKEKYPPVMPEHWHQEKFVSTYALVDTLSKLTAEKDLFVPENSGAASEVVMQAVRLKKGQRVITTNGLGSMGSGLPATIGACVAAGKQRTISVIGDGSWQMNLQDLETVVRLKLPIKYFILNNDGYGSIRNTQRNYFKGRYVGSCCSSGVTLPSLAKIAAAYNLDYFEINKNSELEEKVGQALRTSGPVVCAINVDPNEPTMPKLQSQIKPDGSMVSKPLEDLWPFLDREEFRANMIVKPLDE
ncbi:MAG: thiamine pyrophosphate-binding protein, partial [Candidatus Margulisbacteria bacterium]|nr:thiamine pyrophosphate-binding protein [Candidatus Margulisiibacteriota bacterium]